MRIAAHSIPITHDPAAAFIPKAAESRLAGEKAVAQPELAERIQFNIYNDGGQEPTE